MSDPRTADRMTVLAAFAAIYFVWGSTYLGIKIAIETIPPLMMIGARSLLAGAILYGWSRLQGSPAPSRSHWLVTAVAGCLLFAGGQGALAWAETRVPSGVAALIIATIPIWMTILGTLRGTNGGLRPRTLIGLATGLLGMALLAEPSQLLGGAPVDPLGACVLLGAALSWSIGSIMLGGARLPDSSVMVSGMNLLTGGALLVVLSLAGGERVTLGSISQRSLLSLIYLIVFGSVITFVAYTWLMRRVAPERVATYAFVNPIVAVFFGWLLGGESISMRIAAAAILLVTGVAAIVTAGHGSRSPAAVARALEGSEG